VTPNATPHVFKGSSRCAYYFNVPFDNEGNMDLVYSQMISRNINLRLTSIMQNFFEIRNYANQNIVNIHNHFDSNAKFQNRVLSVRKSNLRSKHTGNTIGYGVIVKFNNEIPKDGIIGQFEGSRIVVLTPEEHDEIKYSTQTWQFYSLELALNADSKRNIRLQQGDQYIEGLKYTAYLDCSESAKKGTCLISYCNSPKDAYTFYGAAVETNAYLSIGMGSKIPSLHANKKLSAGSEILWSYKGVTLPRTVEEEIYSKVSASEFPNEWVYSFSRNDVLNFINGLSETHPRFMESLEFLDEAITNIEDPKMYSRYITIDLTFKHFAQHRMVPQPDPTTGRIKLVSLSNNYNNKIFVNL